jgi:hypothetical protein
MKLRIDLFADIGKNYRKGSKGFAKYAKRNCGYSLVSFAIQKIISQRIAKVNAILSI